MSKNHYGKFISPEQATASVSRRAADTYLRDVARNIKKHEYAKRKEEDAIANYRERMRIVSEKYGLAAPDVSNEQFDEEDV